MLTECVKNRPKLLWKYGENDLGPDNSSTLGPDNNPTLGPDNNP